jgi:hypothetical protein
VALAIALVALHASSGNPGLPPLGDSRVDVGQSAARLSRALVTYPKALLEVWGWPS